MIGIVQLIFASLTTGMGTSGAKSPQLGPSGRNTLHNIESTLNTSTAAAPNK